MGFVFLALFLAGTSIPSILLAQTGEQIITQEYFVQQEADEALLIKISAFEAEFESKLSGQSGELLLLSEIPGSRLAPVYQYVNIPKNARQLNIEVTSGLHTRRSQFGLELTRLKVWDDRSESVARAYQLLSFGMQTIHGDSKANWTVKIDNLLNAGKLFQQFGMTEMRLWANYLAAHLIQFHLHDHSIVYSMTREILADLKGTRFQTIELAALQLQSTALIGLKRSGSLNISESNPDPVQTVLARSVALAQSLDLKFEQAHALSISGAEYASATAYAQALEQFQLAVAIADSVGDAELATGIRENIQQIHATQGNTVASGEVLREIETQLAEDGAEEELALNLLAQGRLLVRSHRYDQAIDVLYQALNYENDSAIRKQINFELAKTFFQTGRIDESMAYLKLAEVNQASAQLKRVNSVIDLADGLRILANIHRAKAEYKQMREARITQGQSQPLTAQYLYDQGLDELTPGVVDRQRARSRFRRSYSLAVTTGQVDLQDLSLLQICALVSPGDKSLILCSKVSVKTSYERLLACGVPRFSTQAMLLWTQILVNNGQQSEAFVVMDHLLDEVHLYRHSLPGVLGNWYQEHHQHLFDTYLAMSLNDPAAQAKGDGFASLLALSKIRTIQKYTSSVSASNTSFNAPDLLRAQLAQRMNLATGQSLLTMNNDINQSLAKIRSVFKEKVAYLSRAGLQKYLRSLASDEEILTFHISATSAHVWLGHKGKVQHRSIANPAYVYSALQQSRQGLADIGKSAFERKMDELGRRLLAPVADLLTKTIYWIPAGPLLGFPLDATRLNGRYLVEGHSIVNLTSFPVNTNPKASLQVGALQHVFLAGHPQDYTGDYATRLNTSTEIRAIADIFVGPRLRIVQGAALLLDEFESEDFKQAGLVHLSMPGIIDLKHPEQSSFELSGSESGIKRPAFRPEHIQSQQLDTKLVFLSASTMQDSPLSSFNNHLGLVSDFLDVGVHSVITSLWAKGVEVGETFMADFYRNLEDSGNTAAALRAAKLEFLHKHTDKDLYDWASFQLYIE